MLSDECKKCNETQKFACGKQFKNARKQDKIFCRIDGSVFVINKEY